MTAEENEQLKFQNNLKAIIIGIIALVLAYFMLSAYLEPEYMKPHEVPWNDNNPLSHLNTGE